MINILVIKSKHAVKYKVKRKDLEKNGYPQQRTGYIFANVV